MNVFFQAQFTQIPLWINSHKPHFPQKTPYMFGTNQWAKTLYEIYHSKNSLSGMFMILFIHFAHQIKIILVFFNRLVEESTHFQIQKCALSSYADSFYGCNYFFEGFSIPSFSESRLQKSTSISSLPIFSYKAFSLLSKSSSGDFVEKISKLRDKNSLFQLEIIWGWIEKKFDSSFNVSCYLIASIATWALNAALCLLLFVIIRVELNIYKFFQWPKFQGIIYPQNKIETQIYSIRVEGIEFSGYFKLFRNFFALSNGNHFMCKFFKDLTISDCVSFGKITTCYYSFAKSKMIGLRGVGTRNANKFPESFTSGKLYKHHNHQLISASKRFNVFFSLVFHYNTLKSFLRKKLNELCKTDFPLFMARFNFYS